MPTTINFLTVVLKIGGQDVTFVTDGLANNINAAANDLKAQLTTALANGISFKMRKGDVLTINVGDFVDWVSNTLSDGPTIKDSINTFVKSTQNINAAPTAQQQTALNGITVSLWDLSISASKPGATVIFSFGFNIKITLDNTFYTGLLGADLAPKVTNIFAVNSVAFGLTYKSQ